MQAYTYLIGWKALDLWYYGVRCANKADPEFDLWIKYFTSSKVVKSMRSEHGEPDVIEVRKKFKDPESARAFEERVIRRMKCVESPKWINRGNGGKKFHVSETRSPEVRQKISKSLTGRKRPEFSEQWKKNLSAGKIGKPIPSKQDVRLGPKSEEAKQKIRDSWSPERRSKQAEIGRKAKHDNMTGKKHSPETIQRMRDAWVLRKARANSVVL